MTTATARKARATTASSMLFDPRSLYDRYLVRIAIRNRIDGGVPKNPKLISSWIKSKTGYDDEKAQEIIDATMSEIDEIEPTDQESAEKLEKAVWCGFKVDDRGHYIETRQVKAMLRESGQLLGIYVKKRGSKQIMQHGFEIKGFDGGDKVYLPPTEIKNEERPIHAMTPKGPISALKRVDYVESGEMEFEVWVLKTDAQEKRHIGVKEVTAMLTHAQENGLGANRSQGSGKFTVLEFNALD